MTIELALFLQENAYMLIYAVVLIVSLVKYKYYFESSLKALPILLAYILLTEIFGLLIRDINEVQIVFEDSYQNYNHLIYNLLDLIFFLYFFYIYYWSTTNQKLKVYIKWGTLLFCLVSILNPFFESFILKPQLLVILTGSVELVLFAYLYLKEYRNKPASFSNYRKLLRWISIGLLIFYPFYPLIIGISQLNEDLYYALYLRKVLLLLIMILYGCFIVGFLRMGKTT
jgi:hypothetical protein